MAVLMTMLQILFIGLKLTHTVEWSWVWILAPIWVSLGFAIWTLILVTVTLKIMPKRED